jgi:DNA-binding response OmpR family regulator
VQKVRVLLVDDDPDDRWLAARSLSQALASPQIVEIGDDGALETALQDSSEPALAVTDYALDWSDGLSVFQRVRAVYPHCPVIVFTGVGDETLAVQLLKAGVDDYLVKHGPRDLGEAALAAIKSAGELNLHLCVATHSLDSNLTGPEAKSPGKGARNHTQTAEAHKKFP